MPLRVFETVKILAVEPPAVGGVRFQFHLVNASAVIAVVVRFLQPFRVRMSLLNVTFISTTPGATSLVPASGTVLTTTGAMLSISWAVAK